MRMVKFKSGILAIAAVLSVAVALPAVVAAEDAKTEESTTHDVKTEEHRSSAAKEQQEQARKQAQTNVKERVEVVKTRLENAKLKTCESHEQVIKNIMARISDRGQKHLDLFTTIADRTEKFYEDKGKVLSNYEQLVADVAAKKAAAQAAVNKFKSEGTAFNCNGENPKGVVTGFKDNHQSGVEALKAYRTAVKNLIVGVKSVNGSESSDNGGAE